MAEQLRDYKIVKNYLHPEHGHVTESLELFNTTLQLAWSEASKQARELDSIHGDGHFWSVDVMNPQGGSYVQLFHGRLE